MIETRIGKYLVVRLLPAAPGRKTSQWTVHSKGGATLGRVEWYGAWRQYVFAPAGSTVFNKGCLADIGEFLGERNFLHGYLALYVTKPSR